MADLYGDDDNTRDWGNDYLVLDPNTRTARIFRERRSP